MPCTCHIHVAKVRPDVKTSVILLRILSVMLCNPRRDIDGPWQRRHPKWWPQLLSEDFLGMNPVNKVTAITSLNSIHWQDSVNKLSNVAGSDKCLWKVCISAIISSLIIGICQMTTGHASVALPYSNSLCKSIIVFLSSSCARSQLPNYILSSFGLQRGALQHCF